MKFSVLLFLALCICIAHNSEARPKTSNAEESKLEVKPSESQTGSSVSKTDDQNKASSGSPTSKKTDDTEKKSVVITVDSTHHSTVKKCPDVVCSPPPTDANCETSNDPSLNVMSSIMGPLSDCCQLWLCTRTDGSFFTHYGITSIGGKGPEPVNFVTPFSGHFFNHGQVGNTFPSFGHFGMANTFAGQDGRGQGQINTVASYSAGQYVNPIQFPPQFPPQTAFPSWGTYNNRDRRDSNHQLQSNFGQTQNFRQGPQQQPNARQYVNPAVQYY